MKPRAGARAGRLLAVNVAACVFLLIQYLLGMVVNVYVVLPGRHPGAAASDYFTGAASGLAWVISDGPGWAAAHAAFGMALAVAALASIALARRQDGRLALVLSVLGALAIVGAGFNGTSFLDYGHAFSSMIMAGLWALALACYLGGVVLAARRTVGALGLRAAAVVPGGPEPEPTVPQDRGRSSQDEGTQGAWPAGNGAACPSANGPLRPGGGLTCDGPIARSRCERGTRYPGGPGGWA